MIKIYLYIYLLHFDIIISEDLLSPKHFGPEKKEKTTVMLLSDVSAALYRSSAHSRIHERRWMPLVHCTQTNFHSVTRCLWFHPPEKSKNQKVKSVSLGDGRTLRVRPPAPPPRSPQPPPPPNVPQRRCPVMVLIQGGSHQQLYGGTTTSSTLKSPWKQLVCQQQDTPPKQPHSD